MTALAYQGHRAATASTLDDNRYMRAALAYGQRGLGSTAPNPSVGALVVQEDGQGGRILGRGWTQPGGRPHGETIALAEAGEAARGATLYVTLEPCSHHGKTPPCADAIVAAGVARVVVAMVDPDSRVSGRGIERMRAHGIAVDVGVGERQALRAHLGHIRRTTLGRPMVQLKMALSSDGMIGIQGADGPGPVPISCPAAFARAHMLRAQADAIMVGVGTVLADNPQLTCRLPGLESASPMRIVVDAHLRTPANSRLVSSAREVPVRIVTSEHAPVGPEIELRALGVDVLRVHADDSTGAIDLAAMLGLLGTMGVTRLMVEGGATLANALLDAGLVDEAVIVEADTVVGPDGVPAFSEPVAERLARVGLFPGDSWTIGRDFMTIYELD